MTEVEETAMGPEAPETEEELNQVEDLLFINNIPCYTTEHTVKGFKIFERIGWDDRVGATYLVQAGDKELVMRVGMDKHSIVAAETLFLNKADTRGLWPHFSQVHSSWQMDGLQYLTVYFRPGPSLRQIVDFMPGHKFSLGTVARFGKDILKCLQCAHSLGYVARCLNIELFHFCAASRHLFMADISNIRLDPTSFGHSAAAWTGGNLLSPLRSHKGEGLARGDELESFLYLLVLLFTNQLPWDSVYADQIEDVKKSTDVVEGLGSSWKQLKEKARREIYASVTVILLQIFAVGGKQIVDESVYKELYSILDTMAIEGGVNSEEDNFDFERDPDPEELPKFVLEKRPIESIEEENSSE